MNRTFFPGFLATAITLVLFCCFQLQAQIQPPAGTPASFVNPLIGTNGEGNTYPGAVAPFGMIQISPDTEDELWETASGYEYSDASIIAFSLTHFSGTGIPDLGDIRFMPQIDQLLLPGPS